MSGLEWNGQDRINTNLVVASKSVVKVGSPDTESAYPAFPCLALPCTALPHLADTPASNEFMDQLDVFKASFATLRRKLSALPSPVSLNICPWYRIMYESAPCAHRQFLAIVSFWPGSWCWCSHR